ncbi:MAG: 5-formyltetrahydrofolate cyclo-ligase [Alphaproteobacteria bacterium]
MNPVEEKRRLRAAAAAGRARIAAANPAAGTQLAALFPDSLLTPPRIASAYWPMRDEMDVRPLMRRLAEAGWQLALPVVVRRGEPLVFRRWDGGALVPAAFGQLEPGEDCPELVPDVLLVPLLAFDRQGRRLGYGGGFYDRTLAALRRVGRPVAVGVAFAGQEVAAVPCGCHDQALDWILTEREAIAAGAAHRKD